jgi:hypothetical protein
MGTAYEWHPGSRCLNPQWAVPVPLLPDELFSSWLVRAAIVQGCDPLELTGELWPRWRAWVRDIDRGLGQERLVPLSKMTGISAMAFEAATLRPVAEVVAGMPFSAQAVWSWMLALGSRNRKRHGGLQYCPVCVATDAAPYYRLQWRFAWHTICTTHECLLLDRCPHCQHPIEPNRLTAEDEHVAVCATCRGDLRGASVSSTNECALDLQRTTDHAIATRSAQFGDSAIGIRDWFELLRWFAGILRLAASRPSGNLARLVRCLGLDPANITPPGTGLAIEFLSTPERAALLSTTWDAITAGPDRLLEAALEAKLTDATLRNSHKTLPDCLEHIAANLPMATKRERHRRHTLTPRPASPAAVRRKWACLQRRMRAEQS